MQNIVFVVEGSHDVSFIGKLLKGKGFSKIQSHSYIPDDWRTLYPVKFPFHDDQLDRVVRFPEIYIKDTLAVGLINSGGDSKLISSLRNALDAIGEGKIRAAVIFSDADDKTADYRFKWSQSELRNLNESAVDEGAQGYPVTIPSEIASLEGHAPKVGVFVFPNNKDCGSLEDVLFSCSEISHPELSKGAKGLVNALDEDLEPDHRSLKKMRRGLGKAKSTMGTIATILKPGSSLAVAVEQGKMVPDKGVVPSAVTELDEFLDECLK
ncbi:DUF3226 domain-containing protein [Phaeobacter inhibens]|uniref:DUF3226 domain-containing protein n=1 Tax=Phaeobacter inhibens TaxID=221822 RepID=UPI0021A5E08C|nr:DUF3226 domain-containing protein [Phaeobacter inhibens]UWR86975.1 hypothetical protein K4L01_09265 [Phaeobacter inhibens]